MALVVGGTDYVQMPVGTTGQRPTTPAAGMTRYNSTTGLLEYYNGSAWVSTGTAYVVNTLVVAGGGSGGYSNGGGGGAGGLLTNVAGFVKGTTYTITVGAGGAALSSAGVGNNGNNSLIT